ncbi:isocitrate lyase/phosphoenolpyruvate mutase family protein [Streptomyces sp. NPDC058812]|uniref:isocitrate lyase/phosphoenolpyruvate mutase family protein n=1 Tax=unclassified Streptomyces TaxID=2593676 RepID=UPI0036BC18F6
MERAAAYPAAGADGVFVPGAVVPGTVKELADGVDGPLNVMAGPGVPPVAELAALGVARVSVGSGSRRPRTPWSTAPRGSCWTRGPTAP